VNLHPLAGEEPVYYGPKTRPFQFDYAVVALGPSINPLRRTLALAGITEFGTQAAAEFVTSEQHLGTLLAQLRVQPRGPVPLFEALLRTTITGGVPTQIELVSVHQSK
jgi:NADH dehydrogenase FAD-containing subunit